MQISHYTIGELIGQGGMGRVFKATDTRLEWVPIYASAIAVGFLAVSLITKVSRGFIDSCGLVLLLEAAVGLWGFVLHLQRNLQGPSTHLFDNLVYLAPPMAPLLFPNLMVLGVIALWRLRSNLTYSKSYFPSQQSLSCDLVTLVNVSCDHRA